MEKENTELKAEIERLRKEHDDLLTKALGVEAERDIARDENKRMRAEVEQRIRSAIVEARCLKNEPRGIVWLHNADDIVAKALTSGKEHD